MTQYYLGLKRVQAKPAKKNFPKEDGDFEVRDGYAVTYPDGHTSWSPTAAFDAAYFPMGSDIPLNDHAVTVDMVTAMIDRQWYDMQGGVICLFTKLRQGMLIAVPVGSSDHAQDATVAKIRELMEFALSWAVNGVQNRLNVRVVEETVPAHPPVDKASNDDFAKRPAMLLPPRVFTTRDSDERSMRIKIGDQYGTVMWVSVKDAQNVKHRLNRMTLAADAKVPDAATIIAEHAALFSQMKQ